MFVILSTIFQSYIIKWVHNRSLKFVSSSRHLLIDAISISIKSISATILSRDGGDIRIRERWVCQQQQHSLSPPAFNVPPSSLYCVFVCRCVLQYVCVCVSTTLCLLLLLSAPFLVILPLRINSPHHAKSGLIDCLSVFIKCIKGKWSNVTKYNSSFFGMTI